MLRQMRRPTVPENTSRKNQWAHSLYSTWRCEKLELTSTDNYYPQLKRILETSEELADLSNEDMTFALSIFFTGLKRHDGSKYKRESIFAIASALQRYLELCGRKV
jgi:hypothetical protein